MKNFVATGIHDDLLVATIAGENQELVPPLAAPGLAEIDLQHLPRNRFRHCRKNGTQGQGPPLGDGLAGIVGGGAPPARVRACPSIIAAPAPATSAAIISASSIIAAAAVVSAAPAAVLAATMTAVVTSAATAAIVPSMTSIAATSAATSTAVLRDGRHDPGASNRGQCQGKQQQSN
ncbi:hypothetical protein [Microvirga sp. TS319]|uniref:hypothetical protein n=1 Tax=Microvirga sp. TS319 TaxID=3241165 RepID=UPI003519F1C9